MDFLCNVFECVFASSDNMHVLFFKKFPTNNDIGDLEARVGVAHSNQSFTSKENEKMTV